MSGDRVSGTGRIGAVLRFQAYRIANRPDMVIGVICLVALAFLVLGPLLEIIRDALSLQPYDLAYHPDGEVGSFSLFHLERVFVSPISKALFYRPLLNSLAIGVTVTAVAVSLGSLLAWLLVRTNVHFKGPLGTLIVVPYMMPSWVIALAWLALFKNDRIGGSEGLAAGLLGFQPPDWVSYGFFPIVVTLSLHYFAYAYLLMSGALATVDSELEEAGAISGMGRWQRLSRITLPLLLPALGSAVVLTFIRILGTFGVPALLGLPVRFFTFSTQIYNSINARNNGDAFVLALVLIVIAVSFIWINSRIIGVRKSFVTMTGKGFRRREINLGLWRVPLTILVWVFVLASVLLPLTILLWESLILLPGDYSLDNLTTYFWIGQGNTNLAYGEPGVLLNDGILNALGNSLKLGVSAALFNGFVGLLVGYAVVRGRGTRLSRWLESIAFAPYIFPSIALGAIYIGMFSTPLGPIPALYGTFAILVLITVVKNLPFTSRTGIAAMLQIDRSLEEAARVLGMGWFKRLVRIIMPLSASGLISGMLLTFITAMRELSLIVLLLSPSNMVVTGVIFYYQEQNMPQHSGAVALLLVLVIVLANVLVRLVAHLAGARSLASNAGA
ncbi:ABC transporter permease [Frigidibacter sp. ROC022]|uniref:ABC transporter permease n=1 Tax=Frigidibacter sp. ROC022 TaxID=2971796 RepID=UPI00215B1FC7|nr:iron ABC transporter permease [Frigidibacter sp. ROC022]MCR8725090.1 iron ABC transporter permease [Frigidibacter sp. ROC022]